MTTTQALDYIGRTERDIERAWETWVAAGRPVQLALPFGVRHICDDPDQSARNCQVCYGNM